MNTSSRKMVFILSLVVAGCISPIILSLFSNADMASSLFVLAPEQIPLTHLNQLLVPDVVYQPMKGEITLALFGLSAAILAYTCVTIAFAHFSVSREPIGLVVVFAFGLSGAVDLFYTLGGTQMAGVVIANNELIPFAWLVSRSVAGIFLLGGAIWITFNRKNRTSEQPATLYVKFIVLLVAIGILMSLMAYSLSVPQTQFPQNWIERPYNLVPIAAFLIALVAYFNLFKGKINYLNTSILLSLFFSVFSELYMAFGSSLSFDHYFNSAYILKLLSYLSPFVGFVLDYQRALQRNIVQESTLLKHSAELELLHARYENINQLMPVGVMIVSQKGSIVEVNSTCCELFGYSESEMLRLSVDELVPDSVRSQHAYFRREFEREGIQRQMAANNKSLSGVHSNGSLISLEIGLAPIDIGGQAHVLVSLMNVEERRRGVEELKELNVRYQSINKFMPCGVMIVDPKGSILETNNTCCELFEYSESEMLSLQVEQLVPDTIRSGHAELRRRFAEEPTHRKMAENSKTLSGIRKDGSLIALEIGLAPILLGNQKCILVSLMNVEERRRVLAELEVKNEQMDLALDKLQKTNEQLERFAFICSHDLQEPVRMVLSFSQLLERKISPQLDEKALSYLHQITDGAARAREMISDILDFCRLEQNNESKSSVSLVELCEKIKLTLTPLLEEKEAKFYWDESLPSILGGPTQIFQLFLNLVSNGLKFNNSKAPKVTVSVEDQKNHWIFSVSDNGIGIDEKYIHKLFTIFTRLNSKAEFPGTGIGLAICKKVSELHGAEISISSELNRGTSFLVKWPKEEVGILEYESYEYNRKVP